MNRKLVSFRLPEDLMQDLREKAGEDGISVTELVCRLLRHGLQTTTDDRIASLEDEIRSLKQLQLQQVSFNSAPSAVAPTPVYMFPQAMQPRDTDSELKQRITDLENLMKEMVSSCANINKLETLLVEEVQTARVAALERETTNKAVSKKEPQRENPASASNPSSEK